MQAIIFAAGRGTRMKDLTRHTPKAMLLVGKKPILAHKIDALPAEIDEVVLVVRHLQEQIREHFGDSYKGKRITYLEQKGIEGTAGALWEAKDILNDRFLAMNGDDLYAREDTEECLRYPWAILVAEADATRAGGQVLTDAAGRVARIDEGTEHGVGTILVNTGLYVLDRRIFEYEPVAKEMGHEEYGLPQTMMQAVRDIEIQAVKASFWVQITEPADLEKAAEMLKNR